MSTTGIDKLARLLCTFFTCLLLATQAFANAGPDMQATPADLATEPDAENHVPESHDALREFLKSTINDTEGFQDRFDAEVWLVTQSSKLETYIDDPKKRLELLKAVHLEASSAGINPDLVLSVIQIESAFDRYAISRAGALGLMQVMPFWRSEIGRDDDNLIDALTNLKYGCRILQYYIEMEQGKGGIAMALARYNGSYPRSVYPDKVLSALNTTWHSGLQTAYREQENRPTSL